MRLEGYDYRTPGAYFVTICAYRQRPLFGDVSNGKVNLNALGQLIEDFWLKIAVIRSNVELDASVVMPNHMHGIMFLTDARGASSQECGQVLPSQVAPTLIAGSLGATISQFKSAVAKQSRSLSIAPQEPIWQRNYYEHIIRNERALNEIRSYILQNPARWNEDDLYVE